MAATPEIPRPEPKIEERPEEFIVPETLQQGQTSGIQVVQKNFKSQVTDDQGKPIIQVPSTQVITITPPSDMTTLSAQAKGSTTSSLTWLAAFWLRIIKKAMHFGWKIAGRQND